MFNPAFLGGIAKAAQAKQAIKAAQAKAPEAQEFTIQWPGSPWDGLVATLKHRIAGECIVMLASGRAVSVPPMSLIAVKKVEADNKKPLSERPYEEARGILLDELNVMAEFLTEFGDAEADAAAQTLFATIEEAKADPKFPIAKLEDASDLGGTHMDRTEGPDNGGTRASKMTAAPKTKEKDEKKEKKADKKEKDSDPEKSKKVTPKDKPDTRGDAPQEEDMTKTAKEASTEIKQPPVLQHMTQGPDAVPVENARTAPEASEGLKILIGAAEAAVDATAKAEEDLKAAQAKVKEAKAEEAKTIQAVIDDMQRTNQVVVKIGADLHAVDAERKMASVNIPKSGKARMDYEQALSQLESIKTQAKGQSKTIKEMEAEFARTGGATFNVKERLAIWPAALHAKLKMAAGFMDVLQSLSDWVRGVFGMAQDAEKAVSSFISELGLAEGQESRVASSKTVKAKNILRASDDEDEDDAPSDTITWSVETEDEFDGRSENIQMASIVFQREGDEGGDGDLPNGLEAKLKKALVGKTIPTIIKGYPDFDIEEGDFSPFSIKVYNGFDYKRSEQSRAEDAFSLHVEEAVYDLLVKAFGADAVEYGELKVAGRKIKAGITRLGSGRYKDTNGNSYATLNEAAEAEAHARMSDEQPKLDPESGQYRTAHRALKREMIEEGRRFEAQNAASHKEWAKGTYAKGSKIKASVDAKEVAAMLFCDSVAREVEDSESEFYLETRTFTVAQQDILDTVPEELESVGIKADDFINKIADDIKENHADLLEEGDDIWHVFYSLSEGGTGSDEAYEALVEYFKKTKTDESEDDKDEDSDEAEDKDDDKDDDAKGGE